MLPAAAAIACAGFLLWSAAPARADDGVRACIDASTAGQTQRNAGKLLESRQAMIACARDACPTIVRSHCAKWLTEVESMIPSIVVRVQDASGADAVDARVLVDGTPTKLDGKPVLLDPGDHVVAVEVGGGPPADAHVLLVAGDHARLVTLRLHAGAGAASASREPGATQVSHHVPAGAWVLGAAGLVALGTGAYFVSATSDQLSHLQRTCSPFCTDAQTQPGRTDALLADVLLTSGGVAVAAAILWAAVFPASSQSTAGSAMVQMAPIPGGAMTALTLRY
jgi:hypothetical protein